MKKFLILKNKMLFPMGNNVMRNSKTREVAIEVETDDLVDILPEGFIKFSHTNTQANREAAIERIKNMKANKPDFMSMIKARQPKK